MTDTDKALHAEIDTLFDLADIATWTLEEQARLCQDLDRWLRDLRDVRDEVGALIYDRWPNNPDTGRPEPRLIIPGCEKPLTRRTGGSYTNWDMDDVIRHATARLDDEIKYDRGSGERRSDEQIIAAAIRFGFAVGGLLTDRPKPRVTPLKDIGLRPSEFSEYVEGHDKKVVFG